MDIFRALTDIPESYSSCSLAIGNFDGVHRGHREVIRQAQRADGEKTMVVTFHPHPRKILSPSYAPGMIMTRREKMAVLHNMEVDAVCELPFSEYRDTGAVDFMEQLFDTIPIASVSVGYNFFFGRGQAGNPEILLWWSRSRDVKIHVCDPVIHDGVRVSSSVIRNLILEGRIDRAASLLVFPYMISDTVCHGRQEGRKMDFPTINITPPDKIIPPDGVYITSTVTEAGSYPSVTNIGHNPTIDREAQNRTIETYIPFKKLPSLYDTVAAVHFLCRIRSEIAFSSREKLIEKIQDDVKLTIDYWKSDRDNNDRTIDISDLRPFPE